MYRSVSHDVLSCKHDLESEISLLEDIICEERLDALKDIAEDLDGLNDSTEELEENLEQAEEDLEQSQEEVESLQKEIAEIKEEMHSLFSKLMDRMTEMEKVDMYRITKDLQDVLDGTAKR